MPATIRTCLDQDFDDYEVIVCDNDGPPDVRAAIESVATDRVRYVRSPRLLPISENWEFAISQARGEYVSVIGNDDGFLRHALAEIDRLIRETGMLAVHWDRVHYFWPCHISIRDRNFISIPLSRERKSVDARHVIRAFLDNRCSYADLPYITSAAVHHSILDKHRQFCKDRLFLALSPDVYSAFALGFLAGTYVSTSVPMVINGGSCHSNGAAWALQREDVAARQESARLMQESSQGWHPQVPFLPYLTEANWADGFLQARSNLFPDDKELQLDRKELTRRCLQGIRASTGSEWNQALDFIRASISDSPQLLEWFESIIPSAPTLQGPRISIAPDARGLFGDTLMLDASRFGVSDVYGAAQLCESILNYRSGVNYDLPSRENARREAEVRAIESYWSNQDDSTLHVLNQINVHEGISYPHWHAQLISADRVEYRGSESPWGYVFALELQGYLKSLERSGSNFLVAIVHVLEAEIGIGLLDGNELKREQIRSPAGGPTKVFISLDNVEPNATLMIRNGGTAYSKFRVVGAATVCRRNISDIWPSN